MNFMNETITNIPTDKLFVSEFNVRKELGFIEDLMDSIKSKGILQPLVVRPSGDKFEIIIGQRRFLAGNALKLKELPCIKKEWSDVECIEASLIENIQQRTLGTRDTTNAIRRLSVYYSHDLGMTTPSLTVRLVELISKKIGLKRAEIFRYDSFLDLSPEVQKKVEDGDIDIQTASKMAKVAKEQKMSKKEQKETAKELQKLKDREKRLKALKEKEEHPEKPMKKIAKEVKEESRFEYRVEINKKMNDALKKACKELKLEPENVFCISLENWLTKKKFLR